MNAIALVAQTAGQFKIKVHARILLAAHGAVVLIKDAGHILIVAHAKLPKIRGIKEIALGQILDHTAQARDAGFTITKQVVIMMHFVNGKAQAVLVGAKIGIVTALIAIKQDAKLQIQL